MTIQNAISICCVTHEAHRRTCAATAAAANVAIAPFVADALCIAGAFTRGALGICIGGLQQRYLRQGCLFAGRAKPGLAVNEIDSSDCCSAPPIDFAAQATTRQVPRWWLTLRC